MKSLSAFAGGLWIIPVLLFGGAIYSFIRGYLQSRSGSLEKGYNNSSVGSNTNVPFLKCPATLYGFILLVIGIIACAGIIYEA